MRSSLLGVLLVPMLAFGEITGTFTGSFQGFDSAGTPQVQLNLSLQCGLTCTPSAPTLTYVISGGTSSYYASSRTDMTGYIGSGFGTAASGQNTVVNTSFKAGSVVVAEANSCSCYCGNAVGQGGHITLITDPIIIPPRIATETISSAGRESNVIIAASPRGPESIVVTISGAGLSDRVVMDALNFSSDAAMLTFTPKTAGTLTMTVTMSPTGTAISKSWDIAAGTQTGTGGGSSSGTGGGAGAGEPDGPSCSGVGGEPVLLLALALAAARRARR